MRYKNHTINPIDEFLFEIEAAGDMRVPARIYSSESIMHGLINEGEPLQQAINVACLPGIKKYALAMPDIHWGYGFPIGGVAATDWQGGVISPGGVGYDINCGVRLARTGLTHDEIAPQIKKMVEGLFRAIPTGVGSSNAIRKLSRQEFKKAVGKGASWVIDQGFGSVSDLDYIEENGCMRMADPSVLSERSIDRGRDQMGTLGSGNHFLEIDVVDTIYHQEAANVFGLSENQIVILIHTGSRGFGYQVCDDSLKMMGKAAKKYNLILPDRQLASAPIQSSEGQNYLSSMACAANFAWSNRQVIMALAKNVFKKVLSISDKSLDFQLVYDVSHNIAKKEEHKLNGQSQALCVHRKGATRAFGPHHESIPQKYESIGQPVLIPGDMGRYSFVTLGTQKAKDETFGSTCHGAGRVMSRRKAKKAAQGRNLMREMADKGIVIQARGKGTVAEEMPDAYKDVAEVVNVMHGSGITPKVARLRPIGVIKG
ncbi:MAG: RNA-splicing ligase RtcB [Caldithrix sp.]|nr:RNA-splicing ligase RtcB [Caldithrix sp.]